METQFRNLDRAIESQPMPPQFQDTKAMISCNDCYAKSAVKYHWLGLRCAVCDSYNTAQLSILSDPAVEVPVVDNRAADYTTLPERINGEGSSSALSVPGAARHRRHSSHLRSTSVGTDSRWSPYPRRLGRSVSPIRGAGLLGDSTSMVIEADESEDEDESGFWGRNGPRTGTSSDGVDDEMEEEEESEEDFASAMDECDDEEGDEGDHFELLGHR